MKRYPAHIAYIRGGVILCVVLFCAWLRVPRAYAAISGCTATSDKTEFEGGQADTGTVGS